MKEKIIQSLRRHCVAVLGHDPMARGATPEAMKKELETHLQTEGAKKRDPNPCHCYEWCEDDDAGEKRRPSCRLREEAQ